MRKQIFLTHMFVVFVSLLIAGITTVSIVEKHFIKNTENTMLMHARVIEKAVAKKIDGSREKLQVTVENLGNDLNTRLTIVNPEGDVLADSAKYYREMENHLNRPEIKEALQGKIGKNLRYSTSLKTKMMYLAVPIKQDSIIIAVLRLSLSLSEIQNLSRFIWGIILYSTLAGLFVAIIISKIFSIKITKPLENISAAAGKIAEGNFDMKILNPVFEEIKVLTDSFNDMTENLKLTIDELLSRNHETEAILESMADSLIAVNQNLKVVMLNPAAQQMFGLSKNEAIGRHLLEIIRDRELFDSINEVLTTNNTIYKEIKIVNIQETVFRVHIAPIVGEKTLGAVAVLRDISDLRRLEKTKTEFVANVSHELKTPLTSIAGFVETLLDGSYKDENNCSRFLKIIKEETDRMTNLIKELLYLSKIESKIEPIQKTTVDIFDVITRALNVLQTSIREKQHQVILDIPEHINPVISKEDYLLQIMINLLDNAVKYTSPNGKIKVKVMEDKTNLYVTIADNGVGITEESLSRIFERFYRVDKARSKAVGGTGLGLSIVKHLVKGLNGEISVKSELGKGTTFLVTIPLF